MQVASVHAKAVSQEQGDHIPWGWVAITAVGMVVAVTVAARRSRDVSRGTTSSTAEIAPGHLLIRAPASRTPRGTLAVESPLIVAVVSVARARNRGSC